MARRSGRYFWFFGRLSQRKLSGQAMERDRKMTGDKARTATPVLVFLLKQFVCLLTKDLQNVAVRSFMVEVKVLSTNQNANSIN